jgi:imidazolonepropionase-like amidohydrolase
MINEGKLIGPRIKATGYNIESGKWLDAVAKLLESSEKLRQYNFFELAPRLRIDNAADAKKAVDSLIGMGSDVVKFRNLGGDNFFSLARESRRRHMLLVGHAPAEISLEDASNAGMASIEHGETITNSLVNLDSQTRAGQFKILSRNGTMITPTLIGDYRSKLSTPAAMNAAIVDTSGATDTRNKFISDKQRTVWQLAYDSRYLNGSQDWKSFFRQSTMDLREAYRWKVPMLAGTDLGVILVYPGSSIHEEMALMVEKIRMSPADVLQAATIHPAKFFKMQDSLGTIQPGKLADLILLDANPLSDIHNTLRINAVILNGQYFDKSALNHLLLQAASNMKKRESCGN